MKKLILSILIAASMAVTANAKTLVAYFSFPIDGGKESLDAKSGASVTLKDGAHYGNAQFIAQTAAEQSTRTCLRLTRGTTIRATTKRFCRIAKRCLPSFFREKTRMRQFIVASLPTANS